MRLVKLIALSSSALMLSSSAAAFAAAPAPAPTAGAITTSIVGGSEAATALTADEREYADFVLAHSTGQDPADVEKSVRYSNRVTEVANGLRDRFPDSFVEAGVSRANDPSSVAWFDFAGATPPAAADIIADLPFPTRLREGLPYSSAFIGDVQKVAYTAIRTSGLVKDATATADTLTGTISVDVTATSESIVQPLGAVAKKALEARFGNATLPTVNIHVSGSPVGGADILTGGTSLGSCTAGFTVVVSNNRARRGLVTAAHCSDNLRYEGRSVIRYEGELLRPNGNLQWHENTNGEGIRNYIVYETQLRTRAVVGYGNPSTGAYLCRYGITTNAKCDYVRNTSGNTCRDGYCGLNEMERDLAEGGDSGGPWWQGSGANAIARGVHSGWVKPFNTSSFDVFTPIGLLQSQFGLTVFLG